VSTLFKSPGVWVGDFLDVHVWAGGMTELEAKTVSGKTNIILTNKERKRLRKALKRDR